MHDINQDIDYILADKETIDRMCDRLAAQITEEFRDSDRPLIFVTILKGSVFFATDLIRRIPLPCEMEFENQKHTITYIFAAATKKECRGRGYMGKLLKEIVLNQIF
jgi:hypoxanthine-guanine phosphoribosyltransferase